MKQPETGTVTASSLNLRSAPSTNTPPIGQLSRGDTVAVLERSGVWLKVSANGKDGYVHGDFISISVPALALALKETGTVTASKLNVRPAPATNNTPLGQLSRGDEVTILNRLEGWYAISFNNSAGYVSGDFVSLKNEQTAAGFLYEQNDLRTIPLLPARQIPLTGLSAQRKQVARIWNQYGGILEKLATRLGIDTAAAVAVLSVESGGNAFSSNGKMIIRFENHVFWNEWGKNNTQKFNVHFKFNATKRWTGHEFRPKINGQWGAFHGNQTKEWGVLDFARTLHESAALRSISMGLPQIMGFNSGQIGYESVLAMFNNFQGDARYQVLGMFDFLKGTGTTSPMLSALQRKRYEQFASLYNGPGQAARYGELISQNTDLFRQFQ